MKKHFHILNGDALKSQFPREISGTQIVVRECLVDGNVGGATTEQLYETRAKFIAESYPDSSEDDYFNKSVTEFNEIQAIPNGSSICLWFEDDLFCQVNMWFVLYLLKEHKSELFLVRPKVHTSFGFGGLSEEKLVQLHQEKQSVSRRDELATLWTYYQHANEKAMLKVAVELDSVYPFLLPAVQAYEDSIAKEDSPGRPIEVLMQIKKDLNTKEFGPIFKEFCQREPIYGFGDLQVARLLKGMNQG